jgi:hypothetical protein
MDKTPFLGVYNTDWDGSHSRLEVGDCGEFVLLDVHMDREGLHRSCLKSAFKHCRFSHRLS